MKHSRISIPVAALWGCLAGFPSVQAADNFTPSTTDSTDQQIIEVRIQLGTKTNELVLVPQSARFENGKIYRLVIENPSEMTHYFLASTFGGKAVQTRMLEISTGVKTKKPQHYRFTPYTRQLWIEGWDRVVTHDYAPRLVHASEGHFNRPWARYETPKIKVQPGDVVVWEFVPVQTGHYNFGCSIPHHAEAGMKGYFVVG